MKAFELIRALQEKYPETAAEEWDNVGLQVGNDRKEVEHVFLALDVTMDVIAQAVLCGADMLITHHPMIFTSVKKINNHSDLGRKIMTLIREDIPYYAMHTNYDILGMADLSARYLNLKDTRVLAETGEGEGFGRVGLLPLPMSLRDCGEYVRQCLRLPDVRIYGDPDKEIRRAAVCTGSGKSFIDQAVSAAADVYVTGDIDYHTALDTMARGLALIDAGHYGTEYIFTEAMKHYLNREFPHLEVTCEEIRHPFITV
ncbi:MAG: Nif3-like dinuclear metal center hexameric protein [Blautia sp.]|nr:Nif3-like dinuclear metal center hexameric protein [Blautia sp.]